jgi:Transcriptional regulator, AbiEi antitoxin
MRTKSLPQAEQTGGQGTHGPLAELARRQHGVVSLAQLTSELGYSRSAVTRAATAGRLHRLHRGVYAVGHTGLSLQGRCLAAVLSYGPRALLSHHSAAWLWGIARWSPVPISVTVPSPRARRPPIRLHHARALAPADRDEIDRIPVTSVPRTALDLAATLKARQLLRLLERAEELRFFDLSPFEDLLTRSHGHPGAGRLRCALDSYRPPPFTRSGTERRFLELVIAAGMPRPITGFVEAGYELDVYWPDRRFAVELDVYETHGSRQAFESDRRRQEDLKLAGIEMVRITGLRLDREPQQVVQRISRLLEQRRTQLGSQGAVEV